MVKVITYIDILYSGRCYIYVNHLTIWDAPAFLRKAKKVVKQINGRL